MTQTIVLAGPGKNALSTGVMEAALAALRSAGDGPVLLTGEGDAFCAGLNLKEVAGLDDAGLTRFVNLLENLVQALYEHRGPTVAWVNGHAIAGGCVLAVACDVRVMTSDGGARMGLNEVALGLRLPPRTLEMVRLRVPAPSLSRVLLEATLHSAAAARELGLVDTVGTEAEAAAILTTLASYPREAYAATKRALRGSLSSGAAEEARFLREEALPRWRSPEVMDRFRALKK